jgi:hypothetical protein
MPVLDSNQPASALPTPRRSRPANSPSGRRFHSWLIFAGSIGFSLAIPGWMSLADPPAESRARSRAQIRFPQRLSIKQGAPAKQGSPIKQGSPARQEQPQSANRLTDVGRSTAGPEAAATPQVAQPPIHVASEEERNQSIATDWKDPWLVFFVTGNQYGYLEPCGCTGLENQKGGVNRKDTLLTSLRQRGWNLVPVDCGNQVRRDGRQSEIKFHWTAHAFREMEYAAVAFGKDDLQLSFDSSLVSILDTEGSNQLFVSANVSFVPDYDLRFKTVTVTDGKGRTHKIGITSVLGDEHAKKVKNEYLTIEPVAKGLSAAVKSLAAERCDYQVLIAHASLDETRAIVKEFPNFDLVVTSGGYGEPTYRPETLPGIKSQIVQAGTKGMYAGIVGLFDDEEQPLRYQRIALSSQFEDSPRMLTLFGKYQDELKAKSDDNFQMLGLRPLTHPTQREFVGSEKCSECHTEAFDIWKNTPHAHATDSIVEPPERSMARHFDPECISCHVTGWNPQKVYPYLTGYESLDVSSHLLGNGCENCHGPGSKHVEAELGDIEADEKMLEQLRFQMRLTMERAQDKCLECHDIDNSPDFHEQGAFEEYWEKVKH